MRGRQELLEVSGYAARPRDFDQLLRILDAELRLITPTDPEGLAQDAAAQDAAISTAPAVAPAPSAASQPRFYQLTHDYLVPSLRTWLTRKQRETRRGRAGLLLEERAAAWNHRPENRQLPSLLQFARARLLTRSRHWKPAERRMMRRAARYHGLRVLLAAAMMLLLGWAGYEARGRTRAAALRDRLLDAGPTEVAAIMEELPPYRRWANGLLREALQQARAAGDAKKELHASLALLPVDAGQVDFLADRLLAAEPREIDLIRRVLAPHRGAVAARFWAALRDGPSKAPSRLRAAAALALYAPRDAGWNEAGAHAAQDLVAEPAVYLATWLELLRDARLALLPELSAIFASPARPAVERSLATDILADYAADQPALLADLLCAAEAGQFEAIFPVFQRHGAAGRAALTATLEQSSDPDANDNAREALAKRQERAAAALLRMNEAGPVWPLLAHGPQTPDPRRRSYVVHKLAELKAPPERLIERLANEPDVSIQRALILALGEYGADQLPETRRQPVIDGVKTTFVEHADAGLHAAAQWLLRKWGQQAWLEETLSAWADDAAGRAARLAAIGKELQGHNANADPQAPRWYVNGQQQTLLVVPGGPVTLQMGSPAGEAGRSEDEARHARRINRTYAVTATHVTLAQYRGLAGDYELPERFARSPDLPVVAVNWFMAAEYCNLLSKAEGIAEDEWCYQIEGNRIRLKPNYLSLAGYRLPTEAEMEYATRAWAQTSRHYGETQELLQKYGWYVNNSQEMPWPVGGK
jgi:hypothetical protein